MCDINANGPPVGLCPLSEGCSGDEEREEGSGERSEEVKCG